MNLLFSMLTIVHNYSKTWKLILKNLLSATIHKIVCIECKQTCFIFLKEYICKQLEKLELNIIRFQEMYLSEMLGIKTERIIGLLFEKTKTMKLYIWKSDN